LSATLLDCLAILFLGLGHVQASDSRTETLPADWATQYEPYKLEFIAGPDCISMPAGVSRLYISQETARAAASGPSARIDSAVVDGVVVTEMSGTKASGVALSEELSDFLAQYGVDYVARNVPPAVPGETFDVFSDGVEQSYDLSVFYRLHFTGELDASLVKAALETVPCIDSVGYWPVIEYLVQDPADEEFRGPFRDQESDGQWYLKAPTPENPGGIDVEGAWRTIWDEMVPPAEPDVVIGIPDGKWGTHLHPDLEVNADEASRIMFSDLPWSPHGTWVSGVTSAGAGNGWSRGSDKGINQACLSEPNVGMGIVGIAPTVRAIYVNNAGAAVEEGLERGLEALSYLLYYHGDEVDVINCSWGSAPTATLRALTEVAVYDEDIVVVAGAGNIEVGGPISEPYIAYPANYRHVISVGASTQSGSLADFSNYGHKHNDMKVDMLAPGESILTTGSPTPKPLPSPIGFDEDLWSYRSGTSFSAPMVVGVIALMRIANPDLSAATIYDLFAESCHQPDGFTEFNDTTGYGIVNAQIAVQKAKNLRFVVCDTTPGDVNADCHVNHGDILYLRDFMFAGGPEPPYPDNADANGDCELSLGDLSHLIMYVFMDGEPPLPGCSAPGPQEDDATESLASPCLLSNYPNPFNPTTTIRYTLPEPAVVTLEVYNTLGQRLVTLVNDRQLDGEHTVEWDGCDASGGAVASGIYFYRLTAGDHAESRKMMLMK